MRLRAGSVQVGMQGSHSARGRSLLGVGHRVLDPTLPHACWPRQRLGAQALEDGDIERCGSLLGASGVSVVRAASQSFLTPAPAAALRAVPRRALAVVRAGVWRHARAAGRGPSCSAFLTVKTLQVSALAKSRCIAHAL